MLLIRPGSTDFDRQGRIQGTLDIPLSDEGREEVARSLESLRELGIQVIYAAPGDPAGETGQILGDALQVKVKTLDKLLNLNHGLWQGMLIQDVRTKQPRVYRQWQENPETICPPGGEMLTAARDRVRQAIARLVKKHRDGAIALVLPEPLASIAAAELSHEPIVHLWKPSEGGQWVSFAYPPQPVHSQASD